MGINGTGHVQIMLEVDDDLCRVCKRCLASEACRGKAFRILDKGEAPFIDMSRCWGCMLCIPACPAGAVGRHEYP